MSHWFYITPEEREDANRRGISDRMIWDRMNRTGWSKERALTEPPYTWHTNKKWEKIREENGICLQTFKGRISRGWDHERAATEPVQQNKKFEKYPETRKYESTCKENGIPWRIFLRRVRVSGWSMDRAASEPLWTKSQSGNLGAKRLREREGDWGALIFGKSVNRATNQEV